MGNICIRDKREMRNILQNHTHTTRSVLLTSFISLLGTDLMIFPVKHKYFISVIYGCVTFCLCLRDMYPFTATQGQTDHTKSVCLTCSPVQT